MEAGLSEAEEVARSRQLWGFDRELQDVPRIHDSFLDSISFNFIQFGYGSIPIDTFLVG